MIDPGMLVDFLRWNVSQLKQEDASREVPEGAHIDIGGADGPDAEPEVISRTYLNKSEVHGEIARRKETPCRSRSGTRRVRRAKDGEV